jgi:predicted transcriptional regulator
MPTTLYLRGKYYMEKANKSIAAPSITSVIKKISNDKALILFNSIAVSSSNNEKQATLKEMNLSTKQYYSRISGLQNTGLIKRHKGKYYLTLLGRVVYDTQMIIGQALTYYWKLKALEEIEMSASGGSPSLPNEEKTQLINAMIDNDQIKDILLRLISIPSVVSKSKTQIPTVIITKDPIPKYLREERMNRF